MTKKHIQINKTIFHKLILLTVAALQLTACSPHAATPETTPIIAQPGEVSNEMVPSGDPTKITATLDKLRAAIEEASTRQAGYTPTPIPSATPQPSPTPEMTEQEKMHEYCIQRAKEVGINLEDLASSKNLWVSQHPSIASFQEEMNNNFTNPEDVNKLMIVVGVDGTENDQERSKRVVSDGGWEILGWAEAIYQRADGYYQSVLLPLGAYSSELDKTWLKMPRTGTPFFDTNPVANEMWDIDYLAEWTQHLPDAKAWLYAKNKHYFGPGAFLRFDTSYPTEALSANDGGVEKAAPRCSEEELAEFRQTGDPSCYEYFWTDPEQPNLKKYYLWPFVTYAFRSELSSFDGQEFLDEFMDWFEYYTGNYQDFPNNSFPKNWEK
jgi:hypothetical protein